VSDSWRMMNELHRTVEQARRLYQERYGGTEALLRSIETGGQSRMAMEALKAFSQANQPATEALKALSGAERFSFVNGTSARTRP